MDKRERDQERRKQRRLEEVGTNRPVCIACGCTDWYTFEGHHIAGRHFDKHVEYCCANCHRRFTEAGKSRPQPSSKSPEAAECAGQYCLGLSDIFEPVARMLDDYGNKLVQLPNSRETGSDTDKSLTTEIGHFLIALAAILGRVGHRLEHYGTGLIDEAKRNATNARGAGT